MTTLSSNLEVDVEEDVDGRGVARIDVDAYKSVVARNRVGRRIIGVID
jgi:hypothetical protein